MVHKKRNLFLGINLAPYRIDFYNYLHDNFDCDIYFQLEELQSQKFNMASLHQRCTYQPRFLKNRYVGHRRMNCGLRELIDSAHPDFVFVPEFSLLTIQLIVIRLLFNYKFKIISMCDDSFDLVSGNDFSKAHRLARKFIPRLVDNLFLVDTRVVDWYRKIFRKGLWMPIISDEMKVREAYEKLLPQSNQLLESYELVNQKVILFVGRLVELKNVHTLLRAFAGMKAKAKLVIIGDGPCMDSLKQLDRELATDVLFLGRLEGDALLSWYNVADVFVLPSTQEAFGAVTNEALLAGCYALVSEKAGSACLIENNRNGFIFDPYNVDDLSVKLAKTLELIPSEKRLETVKENKMTIKFEERLQDNLRALRQMNN